jgi:hypothetical protein
MIRHLVPETTGLISKPMDVDIDATGPRSAQGALKNNNVQSSPGADLVIPLEKSEEL